MNKKKEAHWQEIECPKWNERRKILRMCPETLMNVILGLAKRGFCPNTWEGLSTGYDDVILLNIPILELPADARMIAHRYNNYFLVFEFLFESRHYEIVPQSSDYPLIPAQLLGCELKFIKPPKQRKVKEIEMAISRGKRAEFITDDEG